MTITPSETGHGVDPGGDSGWRAEGAGGETGHGVDPGGDSGWRAEGAGGDFHSSVSVSWACQRITRESS